MSTLINASIRVDKLPKEKFIKGKDGAVYYNLTINVKDVSKFGNNVWLYDSQSLEEREAKKQKHTLGNGRVVFTDGNIVLYEEEDKTEEAVQVLDMENKKIVEIKEDLPF